MKSHLFRSSAGVDHWMVEEGGTTRFAASADVAPVLERNKAAANHNDGFNAARDLKRVASIPTVLMVKWLNEEGWWAYDASKDPDVAKKLAQKLNDPEYAYLRTAAGRVGVSDGVIR